MHRRRMATWIAALALCAIVGACAPQTSAPPPAAPPSAEALPPPEVLVDLPTTGEITDYEDFTGRTFGTRTIDIRARVTGYLEPGRGVRRGSGVAWGGDASRVVTEPLACLIGG